MPMTDTTPAAIEACYLIRKQGAFYRPNSHGYTTSAIQAGRYTLAEAISITHPNGPDGPRDGMFYVHEDEVVCDDWKAYRALAAELAALRKEVERLREALSDPIAVHANMMRGTIAMPSVENIIHIYGAEALRAAIAALKGSANE